MSLTERCTPSIRLWCAVDNTQAKHYQHRDQYNNDHNEQCNQQSCTAAIDLPPNTLLDLESPGNNIWLALLSIASTTLCNIPLVVSCDDILTSVGPVQDRWCVRGKVVECNIEHSCSDEGIDVSDSEPAIVSFVLSSIDLTYRFCPPSLTFVVSPSSPASTILLMKPGNGGMQPMKKANTARQLLPHLP